MGNPIIQTITMVFKKKRWFPFLPESCKPACFTFIFLIFSVASNAQRIIPIWPDTAPGSGSWTWHEQVDTTAFPNDPIVFNVVTPSLTFFPADPSVASGATVIICPGGSFCYLHINTEGIDLAKWLNKIGVSAFVLKYRLVVFNGKFNKEKAESAWQYFSAPPNVVIKKN